MNTQIDNVSSIRRRQTIVATIATIGGFLFGYDTGVISGALLYISSDLNLSALDESIVVSCLLIGAALGGTFGGRVSDRVGRHKVMHFASILFVLATLGSALASGMITMIIARIFLGLAVGAVSAVVPLYLGEIAPIERRGRMVNQNQLMIVIGQLLAGINNSMLANFVDDDHVWRWMLGIAVIPAILFFIGLYFIPDSPRFLLGAGRDEKAKKVLSSLREADSAKKEYEEIAADLRHHSKQKSLSLKELWAKRWVKVIVVMGVAVSFCQQFSGVNAVVYYAPTVLAGTGLTDNAAVTANIAIGAMGVVAVLIGMTLVNRFQRRHLLMAGQLGAAITHSAIAVLFIIGDKNNENSWMILALMVVFVFFQQCFISSVTWLVLSELFPMQIRGFAMGIAVFFNWTSNFIVSMVFPNIAEHFGAGTGFIMFAVLSVIGFCFSKFILPETFGKTLEELEKEFTQRYGN